MTIPLCARKAHGFTLLELLVTIAVAAILLGIAIPSYRGMVQRNAISAGVNDLVGDLNYARSQAVTRGQTVMVCQSADQLTCSKSALGWTNGWIVFAPKPGSTTVTNDNRLRVKSALDAQIQIEANNLITETVGFDANGFARKADGSLSNGTFDITGDDTAGTTSVVISSSGRVRSEPGSGGSS